MADRSRPNTRIPPAQPCQGGQQANSINSSRADAPSMGQPNRREAKDGSGESMDLSDMPSGSAPAQSTMPQVLAQTPAPVPRAPLTISGIKDALGSECVVTESDPAAFAEALTIAANRHESVEIHMVAGLEDCLVQVLSEAQAWSRARLLIKGELRQNFLLQLESALSAAGRCKTLSLDVAAGDGTLPSLPLCQSTIQVDALNLFGGKATVSSLSNFLKQQNHKLEIFAWPGTSETGAVVEALSQGSHQLRYLALSPQPGDSHGLLRMLRCKASLETLMLYGAQPDWRLTDILSAAPGLTHLFLQRSRLTPDNLQGSAIALAQSALAFLELHSVVFPDNINPNNELAQGLARAPRLQRLHFHELSDSLADGILLEAFAKNPAARGVSIGSTTSPANFLNLMNRLNQDREREGLLKLAFGTS